VCLRGREGPCAEGPALSQPRSAGASLSAAPRGIRTALPSMCVPASALPAQVRTVRSPISVGQARDRPHMEPAQSNHTPLRLAAVGSVYASGHAVRHARNYAGRFADGLAVGTIARWFSPIRGKLRNGDRPKPSMGTGSRCQIFSAPCGSSLTITTKSVSLPVSRLGRGELEATSPTRSSTSWGWKGMTLKRFPPALAGRRRQRAECRGNFATAH